MIPDGMLAKVAGSNQFKVGQGDKTWNELEYVASIAFGSGLALDADGKIIVDFSQMPTDKFEALIKQIRVPIWLTKHTNFYVDGATGSDVLSEGRGLSADKAFKTIQACVNYVCDNYNLSRYNATINIAEGLYVENVGLPKYNTAGGRLFISGAGTDKTTVQGCFHGSTVPNGTFTIGYLTVTYADFSASVWIAAFRNLDNCMIEDIAIDFSNIPENVSKLVYAINVATSQVLTVNSKYVNGTRVYDVPNLVIKGGKFVTVFNISGLLYLNSPMHLENVTTTIATIRANGGSNFNRFTYKIRSITGSNVTGKRYLATNYGIIDTGNAGPEFFPGTIDGTCEDGGIYK